MQKLFAFLVFIFCALTLYLTSSNMGMKWVTRDRYSRVGAFGADYGVHGAQWAI